MITSQFFGKLNEILVNKYCLQNEWLQCSSINFGATITNLTVKDKNGNSNNIVLNFDTLEEFVKHKFFYLNCICGRYANRIAKGQFTLYNNNYHLATNLPPNHLHGGTAGFNEKIWTATELPNAIKYSYTSVDMEEGYPGNLIIEVTYILEQNKLIIDYKATTDKATPINLTNHAYFNLNTDKTISIKNHEMQIFSSQFMKVDEDSIPTGEIINKQNTAYDFTQPQLLQEQYKNVDFYDNTWVLQENVLKKAATVYNKETGIEVTCYTTMPSIHFYDGHFLNSPFISKNGLCLEAQFLPDSPNNPNFPNTILKPGQIWEHQTVYEVNVK